MGGYEFTHTVAQVDFVKILEKFNLDTSLEILTGIQQISDAGKGPALKKALTDKEIPNEFFSWIS